MHQWCNHKCHKWISS